MEEQDNPTKDMFGALSEQVAKKTIDNAYLVVENERLVKLLMSILDSVEGWSTDGYPMLNRPSGSSLTVTTKLGESIRKANRSRTVKLIRGKG